MILKRKSLLYRILNKLSRIFLGIDRGHFAKSYSQEGEDMVLRSLVGRKEEGYYVDVGAHHPTWYSNTKHFYDLGWSGINIDANPGSIAIFRRKRKRDTNIEVGIGEEGILEFYQYKDPAFNTFDANLVAQRKREDNHSPKKSIPVSLMPLSKVLKSSLAPNTKIDFLNVDVEGKDFEVLASNDWDNFKPYFILVESYGRQLPEISQDRTYQYLTSKNYELVASTKNTLIFKMELNKDE